MSYAESRAGHYLFISSASAYQTPPARLPITESTPLRNPVWDYSRNKIACEDLLVSRYRAAGLPMPGVELKVIGVARRSSCPATAPPSGR